MADVDANLVDNRNRIIKELQANEDPKALIELITALESQCNNKCEYFSDYVRDNVNQKDFGGALRDVEGSSLEEHLQNMSPNGSKEAVKFLLNCPFFNYPISTKQTSLTDISRAKLSASVIHFQVYFDTWNIPDTSSIDSIVQDKINNSSVGSGEWAPKRLQKDILSLVESSFRQFRSTHNEASQKTLLFETINVVLQKFDFIAEATTEPDFHFEYDGDTIVYGEAKNAFKAFTPEPLERGDSPHYCLYGFCLELARYSSIGGLVTTGLRQNINFSSHAAPKTTDSGSGPSSIVRDLVKCDGQSMHFRQIMTNKEKIVGDASTVKNKQKYALNLFVSTMQATLHSVEHRRNLSIVVSGRVTMFIKLEINDNRCVIRTSDLVMNGSSGYIARLLSFLDMAKPMEGEEGNQVMNDGDQTKWNDALGISMKKGTTSNSRTNDTSNDGDDSSPDGGNSNNSEKGKRKRDAKGDGKDGDKAKKSKGEEISDKNDKNRGYQTKETCKAPLTLRRRVTEDSTGSSASYVSDKDAFEANGRKILFSDPFASSEMDSCTIGSTSINSEHEDTFSSARDDGTSAIMTLKDQVLWQHALSPYKEFVVEDGVQYLGRDEDGILVPYLHQIKDEKKVKEGPLGAGRCGEVRQIPWKDGYAAVKHFRKGDDMNDEKDQIEPINAYKHELEVFRALKSVWGMYIPELLFHTSWAAWRPSIGMELGTGMPDDFSDSEWSNDNIRMRDEAIQAVSNLGYEQDDMRGANFIRLHKTGRIAMIDFESFVKVEKQN